MRVRGRLPGISLDAPARDWLRDVVAVAIDESEKIAELQEEQDEELLRALARQPQEGW